MIRNESETSANLQLVYLPERGALADSVSLAQPAQTIPAGGAAAVVIDASLRKGELPATLNGQIQLSLTAGGKTVGAVQRLTVEGLAPSLKDVTLVPASLTLHSVNWLGFFSRASRATIGVEARGAGLAALFAHGSTFTAATSLRSSTGRELRAALQLHAPTSAGELARGHVEVSGTLAPGSYAGTLQLSPLSATAPQLEIKTESGDSFVWMILAVGLGSLIGGAIYLASDIKRRKDLMQGYLHEGLDTYADKLAEMQADAARAEEPLPIWTIQDLGERSTWFQRRWSALPSIEGVQGLWSQIYWARNEADLDALKEQFNELLGRVTRWLKVALGEGLRLLLDADRLAPKSPPGEPWSNSHACADTALLLLTAREEEPKDDEALRAFIATLLGQARWHAALARVWNLKAAVVEDKVTNSGDYQQHDDEALDRIKLETIDEEAAGAKARTAEKQRELEVRLDDWTRRLEEIFKGDPGQLPELAGTEDARRLAALSAPQARADGGEVAVPAEVAPLAAVALQEPVGTLVAAYATSRQRDLQRAERRRLEALRPLPRARATVGRALAAAAGRLRLAAAPGWLRAILLRDVLWSALVVLIALAVYVPIFYTSTWGNLGDYGSAFLAGFVGKFAVNWALLPAFRSLSPWAKGATVAEIAPAPAKN